VWCNKTRNVHIKVTLRRVRISYFCRGKAVNITYWVCICSLSYPACNAHAPYYIAICGLSGCTVFCRIIS
jgi:hypothetical protein